MSKFKKYNNLLSHSHSSDRQGNPNLLTNNQISKGTPRHHLGKRTYRAITLATLAVTLLAVLLVSCSDAEERVLTMRYWQSPSLLNTYLSDATKDTNAAAITLEPLANYDPDGILVPKLATEIPTLANGGVSADLTSITWQLKDDLKWSDGSKMTADDVVFTYEYCITPDTGCSNIDKFSNIASVTAPDDRTVVITFTQPESYPYTPFVTTDSSILSRAQFADCMGINAQTCQSENFMPLGTGPYRITSLTPNAEDGQISAEYERNPHYHGSRPYFDRIVMTGGGSAEEAAISVLIDGEIDYAWNLQVDPQTLSGLEGGGADGERKGSLANSFASRVERIMVNQTNPSETLGEDRSEWLGGTNPHPLFTNKVIPQAMSMAIDRQEISDQFYGFAGRPTCNLVATPPRFVSDANNSCLTQDIAGANKLLDDNGVTDTDGDGIREYNGMPLRITFQTSTNDIRQLTQNLIRGWWREIGIETELLDWEGSVFFGGEPLQAAGASFKRFFADVEMYANSTAVDPQSSLSLASCENIPSSEDAWGGNNVARICDENYEATYDELSTTTDPVRREELIKQLNDILIQNYYVIPLVNRGNVSAHLDSLNGIRENAWDTSLWNVGDWRR